MPKAAPTPPFEPHPQAARIGSEAEAVRIARDLAAGFAIGAAERDRDRRLPVAELDRFSNSGLWGITVPAAYGGLGASFVTVGAVIALVSAADPSLGQLPQNHLAALDVIRVSASEAQKRLWFDRTLRGYRLGNAFSERNGRHVGAFATTLRRDGGGFVIDGDKFYATGALFAHFIPIGAVDPDGRVHLAIADRAAPGLTVTDSWSGFGQRTTASGDVTLRGVRVGPEAVIPAWRGGETPSSNGAVSQFIQAAVDLGIARGALDETIRFVRTRARPWIDSGREEATEDVLTIHQIGDLTVRLRAAEAMLARAGHAIDAILDAPAAAAVTETAVAVAEAKVLTTEIALLAADKLHELSGTRSVLEADNLDRHWRNARTHTLHDPVRWKYVHIGNHALNGIAPPRHAWS